MMLQTMIMLEFKGGPQMDQSILGNFTAIAETKLSFSFFWRYTRLHLFIYKLVRKIFGINIYIIKMGKKQTCFSSNQDFSNFCFF